MEKTVEITINQIAELTIWIWQIWFSQQQLSFFFGCSLVQMVNESFDLLSKYWMNHWRTSKWFVHFRGKHWKKCFGVLFPYVLYSIQTWFMAAIDLKFYWIIQIIHLNLCLCLDLYRFRFHNLKDIIYKQIKACLSIATYFL